MICSIEGCERELIARGWCRTHYMRWRRHGDPTYRMRPHDHHEPPRNYVCESCGGEFLGYMSVTRQGGNKTCSIACGAARTRRLGLKAGSRSPFWRGGVSEQYKKERPPSSKRWRQLRAAVLDRDGWKCGHCGITNEEYKQRSGKGLHVHHRELYLETHNDELENLEALCGPCHAKADAASRKAVA